MQTNGQSLENGLFQNQASPNRRILAHGGVNGQNHLLQLNEASARNGNAPLAQDFQTVGVNNIKKMIPKLLAAPNLTKERILLKFSGQLNFKTEIYRNGDQIIVQGILIYSNGQCFEVIEGYRKTLIYSFRKNSNIFFFNNSNLKFKAKALYKGIHQIQCLPVFEFARKIQEQVQSLKEIMVIAGMNKSYGSLGLKLKKSKLTLFQKISKIIGTQKGKMNKSQEKMMQNSKESKKGKGCVFVDCQEMHEVVDEYPGFRDEESDYNVRCGGYFQVEKKLINILHKNQEGEQKEEQVEMGIKTIRIEQNTQYGQDKMNRQKKIMSQIQEPQHFLKYYRTEDNNDAIYMEWAHQNFDEIVYQEQNTINELLNLSSQIVKGVKALEKSNIVHRDLKPDNILIAKKNNKNVIKIIDFGESTLTTDDYEQIQSPIVLGSTVPYSPPETIFQSKSSYNQKQIDYWSVGMLIYQIAFKNCPVTYSRSYGKDTYKRWWVPDQFSIFPLQNKKKGIQIIQFVIYLIATNSVCIKQDQRMNLHKMEQILDASINYLDTLLK